MLSCQVCKNALLAKLYHEINFIDITLQLTLFLAILTVVLQLGLPTLCCGETGTYVHMSVHGVFPGNMEQSVKSSFPTRYGMHDLDSKFGTIPFFREQLATLSIV